MTSDELNKAIDECCADKELMLSFITHHEKAVPYIGWYWREVNFDTETYRFGVIPGEYKGFMENNKWDYGYAETTPEEWTAIKALLVVAVMKRIPEAFDLVWRAIQCVGNPLPAKCPATQPQPGLPITLSCIQVEGHEGEHEFAL